VIGRKETRHDGGSALDEGGQLQRYASERRVAHGLSVVPSSSLPRTAHAVGPRCLRGSLFPPPHNLAALSPCSLLRRAMKGQEGRRRSCNDRRSRPPLPLSTTVAEWRACCHDGRCLCSVAADSGALRSCSIAEEGGAGCHALSPRPHTCSPPDAQWYSLLPLRSPACLLLATPVDATGG
jgi:hypothetical protein